MGLSIKNFILKVFSLARFQKKNEGLIKMDLVINKMDLILNKMDLGLKNVQKNIHKIDVGLHAVDLSKKKLESFYDLLLFTELSKKQQKINNPLCKAGFLGFSQSDEDGITLEIIKRMGLQNGFFVEFGVGTGVENNTIILLALGWNGAWFGGENIAFDISNSVKLKYEKVWITKDNILKLYNSLAMDADVISIDLDGNDIYLVEELLLNGVNPKLFIVEYNAKFPPPIEFRIDYDEDHRWNADDYFGASLSSFNTVFSKNGYRLVCCNASGANAFFVHNSYESEFKDISNDINEIFSEPFYFLRSKKMHPTSLKTLEKLTK